LLQSGITNPFSERKDSILTVTVFLLLIISLFKSLLGYIKQQIMVTVSLQINRQLTLMFLNRVRSNNTLYRMQIGRSSIKMIIGDIQKIQNAISLLMGTLVADGTLIFIAVAGLIYLAPIAALITLVSLIGSFFISIKNLPALLYENSNLNGLAGRFETSLLNLVQDRYHSQPLPEKKVNIPQLELHDQYIKFARQIANKLGRISLLTECSGTINVIAVIFLCLFKLQNESMSYTSFMLTVILTYFITTIMNKITGTLYAILDGSDAAIQFGSGHLDKED
jgi:hypothetical protein